MEVQQITPEFINGNDKPTKLYKTVGDKFELVNEKAHMYDLVKEIMKDDAKLNKEPLVFGQFERSKKGLKKLYQTVQNNMDYSEDNSSEYQLLQSIAFAHKNRKCTKRKSVCGSDCKTFSKMIARHLQSMDVNYDYSIIETSLSKRGNYNHIYPIAYLNGESIYMDAVPGSKFNKEKRFKKKLVIPAYRTKKTGLGISEKTTTGKNYILPGIAVGVLIALIFKK